MGLVLWGQRRPDADRELSGLHGSARKGIFQRQVRLHDGTDQRGRGLRDVRRRGEPDDPGLLRGQQQDPVRLLRYRVL
ncbi:MAG: hypothetical protein MZU79_06000 [Anaerotruncus sp.]|nr:hypothetical protein [Anaerotruncus sp.]